MNLNECREKIDTDVALFQNIEKLLQLRGAKMIIAGVPSVYDVANKTPYEKFISKFTLRKLRWEDTVVSNWQEIVEFNDCTSAVLVDVIESNNVGQDLFDGELGDWRKLLSIDRPTMVNGDGVLTLAKNEHPLFNVNEDGFRFVPANTNGQNSLFFFGNSSLLGFFNSDEATIPNLVASRLPDVNVVNACVFGETVENLLCRIARVKVLENDVVVIGYPMGIITKCSAFSQFAIVDLREALDDKKRVSNFIDAYHPTVKLNQRMTELLLPVINFHKHGQRSSVVDDVSKAVIDATGVTTALSGCIFATMNPFTNGHRHIVEVGAKICDKFVIILLRGGLNMVLENDAALRVVELGVSDLKNVIICELPQTFSFTKYLPEYNNDSLRRNSGAYGVDVTEMVEICANAVSAAGLKNVIYGIEDEDMITRQLFTQFKYAFGRVNVNTIGVPRVPFNGTNARKLIRERKFNELRSVVPSVVADYVETNQDKIIDVVEPLDTTVNRTVVDHSRLNTLKQRVSFNNIVVKHLLTMYDEVNHE